MAVLAAKQFGAERIIAMSATQSDSSSLASTAPPTSSRNAARQAWQRSRSSPVGLGAHSVIEAVGTQEAIMQAIGATRGGGHLGYVGVNYDVEIPGIVAALAGIHTLGVPAPVRRYLPDLIQLIWDRKIDPGKVFDLTLRLEKAAEGYQAMDERRATKVLLTV